MSDLNSWTEWSKHILAELQRLDGWCKDISEKQTEILVEIAALKVKAGIWGLVGGAIPVGIMVIVYMLKK